MSEPLTWEQALEVMRAGKHVQQQQQSPFSDISLYMEPDSDVVLVHSKATDIDGKPLHHTVKKAYERLTNWVVVQPIELPDLKIVDFEINREIVRRNSCGGFSKGKVSRHLFVQTPSGSTWKLEVPEGLIEELVKFWQNTASEHSDGKEST